MVMQWQRELPIALESKRNLVREEKELWRSTAFRIRKDVLYQIIVTASWADSPKNSSNAFYCKHKLVVVGTTKESIHYIVDDAPMEVRNTIPAAMTDLIRWNGFHPFGPWFYIENTVFHASNRDCYGLTAGEKRQIVNGRTNKPMWELTCMDSDGNEIRQSDIRTYEGDECPTAKYTLEYRQCYRIGEGKTRELDAARAMACWPDATDEQLMSDDLAEMLRLRLPALLVEFRAVIEGLGFTW